MALVLFRGVLYLVGVQIMSRGLSDGRFIFSQEVSPALQFTGWRPLWG